MLNGHSFSPRRIEWSVNATNRVYSGSSVERFWAGILSGIVCLDVTWLGNRLGNLKEKKAAVVFQPSVKEIRNTLCL